jgi:VTC domain/Domain of unknown function (DUF202)
MKNADGNQKDPKITSLYFDDPKFSLYSDKVEKAPNASSVRLRWYGQLNEKPEILFEKKTIKDGNEAEEVKFSIKEKYIQPYLKGEYKMEKSIQRVRERHGDDSDQVKRLEDTVDTIQSFIKDRNLQPTVRANYTRTAFQIPGDSKIRVALDTELALIREDALDTERPCRDPEEWHRTDIDSSEMEYPFNGIRKGEISRFPYAILDIKVLQGTSARKQEWIQELADSHLVKEAPRFSKFTHGVATLFDDYVNVFPFWLSELENDIRKDPEKAFEEEQQKKARRAEDEVAVGSFMGGSKSSPAFIAAVGSPMGKSITDKRKSVISQETPKATPVSNNIAEEDDSNDEESRPFTERIGGLRSVFAGMPSMARGTSGRPLPPGVTKPQQLIKDSGPVRVEPKVWLANQRTFIKWQHITVLLASLSLGLYNAAGVDNNIARGLAVVYTIIAIFAGVWGWWMYITRSTLIRQRSGKDFDNVVGPVVVCLSLVFALCLNFGFKVGAH